MALKKGKRSSATRSLQLQLHRRPPDFEHSMRKPRVAKRSKTASKVKQSRSAHCILPHDILINILLRLPVKSLARFRCVCKSWFYLTYDPYFVEEQHQRAFDRPIIICRRILGEIVLYDFMQEGQLEECVFNISIGDPVPYLSSNSVNGLVCANGTERTRRFYYLLNPFTREFLMLSRSYLEGSEYEGLGLGFSIATGEYKVVRLSYRHSLKSFACDIFNLGTQEWRYVGETSYWIIFQEPVFLHGTLHWRARTGWGKNDSVSEIIFTFDIENEKFGIISPPQSPYVHHCFDVGLKEFGGHLYFVISRDCKPFIEIWMMKDYRNREWTKTCSIDTSPCPSLLFLPTVIGLTDEKIFIHFSKGRVSTEMIYSYDLQNTSYCELYHGACHDLVIHKESLVSPRKLLSSPNSVHDKKIHSMSRSLVNGTSRCLATSKAGSELL